MSTKQIQMCMQVWNSTHGMEKLRRLMMETFLIAGSVSILLQHSVLTRAAEANPNRQIAEQGEAPLACQSQWESPPSDSTRTPSQNDWTVAWRIWRAWSKSPLISFICFMVFSSLTPPTKCIWDIGSSLRVNDKDGCIGSVDETG